MRKPKSDLRVKDAVRVESAETWLRMGQPVRALQELQRLTHKAWKHPWPEQVMWRTAQAIS